jgi:hypothetical protein
MGRARLGLADIEFAREACKTSLTSTAIRYAELTDDAIAVILSTGRVIGSRGDSYDNALAETINACTRRN